MTHPRRIRRVGFAASLAVLAVTSAALTGCAGDATSSSLDAKDSPLYKILGPLGGLDDKEALRKQERAVQKAAAQCMTDEGFEYKPSDSAASTITVGGPDSEKSEDWVSKNGYGFSRGLNSEKDDPNQDYVDSLSDTQQTAYYEALYGPATEAGADDADADGGTEAEGGTTATGCLNEAYRSVTKTSFWEDEKYKKLLDSASALFEKVEKSPAVKKAAANWSDCMADAGYSEMDTKADAMNHVSEKMSALYDAPGDATGDGQPSEPSAADIKEFRDLEIKVALADFRCDAKTGYENAKLAVQFELEEKFVREHKAELDELVDAYGDKK
ncbi:hypothetical protein [Leifsonia soli]|uniref:DUF3829 domain-containing protein n=1 Tax=Leifsonia soli TaxID=582665 RepID=A0A852SYU9_9MICO|nr:hypothetical protein [Leifsonia soli]NYD73841.1 hypothetical protein [Leifsonia soli]